MRSSRLRIRYIEPGLLLSSDSAWGYFRIPTVSYDFLSEGERESLLGSVANCLAGLRDAECHLLCVPRSHPVSDWATELEGSTQNPAPGFLPYLRQLETHIGGRAFWHKETYLGVLLGRRRRSGPSMIRRTGETAAGIDDGSIAGKELDHWRVKLHAIERMLAAGALRG